MRMFLDDLRIPLNDYDVIVRSYDEAVELIITPPINRVNFIN